MYKLYGSRIQFQVRHAFFHSKLKSYNAYIVQVMFEIKIRGWPVFKQIEFQENISLFGDEENVRMRENENVVIIKYYSKRNKQLTNM